MLVYSNHMTIYELLAIANSIRFQGDYARRATKSEILRNIHSLNNIECKIGNPEWYMLSLTKLRRMMLKISADLSLESSEICEMSKEKILKILFSLDVMFQCYMYSLEHYINDKNRLIDDPEIQKKFIYLGATMGKDFSYLLLNPPLRSSVTLRSCIENKYFGKFADINNLTRYALAYENFENENKYEFMLKQLRQRQIFQEQQLQEIQSQIQLNNEIEEIDRWNLDSFGAFNNSLYSEPSRDIFVDNNPGTVNQNQNKSIFRFKLPKWLLKFKIQFNSNKNNELLIDASCSVCYMSKKNILFTDCGHISACTSCSEKLGFKCPMCRKISDSKMLVFY
ncbi:MAG: RING-HC finger protein [Cetobacterium sp.]